MTPRRKRRNLSLDKIQRWSILWRTFVSLLENAHAIFTAILTIRASRVRALPRNGPSRTTRRSDQATAWPKEGKTTHKERALTVCGERCAPPAPRPSPSMQQILRPWCRPPVRRSGVCCSEKTSIEVESGKDTVVPRV